MEQSRTFITRVAMFEVEKRRYWEAFDFIDKHDRFAMEKEATDVHKKWGEALYERVCVGFLQEFVQDLEEFIPAELAKDKLELALSGHVPLEKRRAELAKHKQLADEAFEKGNFEIASVWYAYSLMGFPDEMSRFLSDAAALAKSKRKWTLLETVGQLNANLLEPAILVGLMPPEDCERLYEANTMISIALRRMLGFDMTHDAMVLRDPARKHPGGKEVITVEKLKSLYPDATKTWLNGNFIKMADFQGKREVTVDDFSHFMNICFDAKITPKLG